MMEDPEEGRTNEQATEPHMSMEFCAVDSNTNCKNDESADAAYLNVGSPERSSWSGSPLSVRSLLFCLYECGKLNCDIIETRNVEYDEYTNETSAIFTPVMHLITLGLLK